jgi:pimeloyl-ACP methyl ester carboxylesterase
LNELTPPRYEGTYHLDHGRTLGYAEYGPSSGRPILWFHGTPGGRRQISPRARAAAHERQIRLIAVERPGVGASTPHPYRRILDWGEDIRRLCDALGLEEIAVAGLSGGGPYALACAHAMPDRVVQVAILGGVAPAVGADAAQGGVSPLVRRFSPLLRMARNPLGRMMRGLVLGLEPMSARMIDAFAAFMPAGDQRVFEDELIRAMFVEDLLLGARTHMQALILDAALFGRDWGFRLDEVEVPVHMWYGDSDNIVPLAHGEFMARRLPRATFKVRPDEGHLGGLAAADEVFDAILAAWPGSRASHEPTQPREASTQIPIAMKPSPATHSRVEDGT